MKLRNKLSIITAAATLAFVGTGFAAWAFTAERKAEASISDKVAVGVELTDGYKLYNAVGNAEVANLYLICDAPSGKDFVLAGAGVYWASDEAGANPISNVYMKGALTRNDEDGVKNISTVTVSFAADHNLASTYITFDDFGVIADTENIPAVDGQEVKSASFALPTVSYVEAKLPHSVEALTAMNTALGTELSSAKISCTAKITAVAA